MCTKSIVQFEVVSTGAMVGFYLEKMPCISMYFAGKQFIGVAQVEEEASTFQGLKSQSFQTVLIGEAAALRYALRYLFKPFLHRCFSRAVHCQLLVRWNFYDNNCIFVEQLTWRK